MHLIVLSEIIRKCYGMNESEEHLVLFEIGRRQRMTRRTHKSTPTEAPARPVVWRKKMKGGYLLRNPPKKLILSDKGYWLSNCKRPSDVRTA